MEFSFKCCLLTNVAKNDAASENTGNRYSKYFVG